MLSEESHMAKHQVKHHYNAYIFCMLEFIPFNYQLDHTCGQDFCAIALCPALPCSCSHSACPTTMEC